MLTFYTRFNRSRLELWLISDISHGLSACAMRTGTVRHEASCACVVLVFIINLQLCCEPLKAIDTHQRIYPGLDTTWLYQIPPTCYLHTQLSTLGPVSLTMYSPPSQAWPNNPHHSNERLDLASPITEYHFTSPNCSFLNCTTLPDQGFVLVSLGTNCSSVQSLTMQTLRSTISPTKVWLSNSWYSDSRA